jgi:hypothetical protein
MKVSVRLMFSFMLLWGLSGCMTQLENNPQKEPQKHEGPLIYLESNRICAFFEVQNLEEYKNLIPRIFKIPKKPLCQITFTDNYKMGNGPTYLLSSISILVIHEGKLGWYILTMPETHEEPVRRGVKTFGYPKIVRKVTLESSGDQHVGISYEEDGNTPEFTLTLKLNEAPLGLEEKQLYDFISPVPSLTMKAGKVYHFGGSRYPAYNLEKVAPRVWKIKIGTGSIEYPNDSKNFLNRMGMGMCITGYWANMKSKYSIAPNK